MMKNKTKIFLKLLIASTLIVVIGFVFLVSNPEEKALVKPAKADIYSFSGLDNANNFTRTVEALGIRPRPYDFNGNIVYFGNSVIENSPSLKETANMVQEELVHFGVNKRNYLDSKPVLQNMTKSETRPKPAMDKDAVERRKAMIGGELVPTRKSNTVYEMSGIKGIDSMHSLKKKVSEAGKGKSFSDFTNGYRYIEIRQEKGSTSAEILAVWTDGDFDGDKMTNKKGAQQSPADPIVPACVGCKRTRRVQALDKSEPYNLNKWVTRASLDETYDFYSRSMRARGWTESGKQQAMNKIAAALPDVGRLHGRGLSLEKDGHSLEITILPNANGAEVFSMEKYDDTQPTLEKIPEAPKNIVQKLLD